MTERKARMEIRKKRRQVIGTAKCPRLSIFRSLNHISARIIDDENSITLVDVTVDPSVDSSHDRPVDEFERRYGISIKGTKKVGELIAKKALEQGITRVIIDSGGLLSRDRIIARVARNVGLRVLSADKDSARIPKPPDNH